MGLTTLDDDGGGVAVIAMADTPRRNALGRSLTGEVTRALDDLRRRGARAVVLRAAAGSPVWSAGYDLSELDEVTSDALGVNESIRALVRTIEEFPAPVVAMIDGAVYGAAVEVALVCDLIVATPTTRFTITPAKLGLMLNVSGLITLLDRLPPAIVKEMVFAAEPVTAERAQSLGLINRVVPADAIEAETMALARRMAGFAPLSLAAMKEEIRHLQERASLSPRTVEGMQRRRRTVFGSDDYREGLAAFNERRTPTFRGD